MIKNYLKSAFRNFLKHKTFTFLNILGLSLGLAASVLILQFVRYELSYDTFHSDIDNIYRIQYNVIQNEKMTVECAAAVPAVGPALKDNFPEVKEFTRLYPISGVMAYESPERGFISFREEKMQFADPRAFEIFDFRLLEGNPETALQGPNKAVISQATAKKYFQDENPIGKTLNWDGEYDFEVTGIFEDVPENSHIKFPMLFSFKTLSDRYEQAETAWGWYDFNTYVLLDDGVNVDELQSKWDDYLFEQRGEEWTKRNSKQEFILQPLRDIHLYSHLLQESEPDEQGDGEAVYFLTIIAFFILIIAWVNYINLSTAKSFERANEVGVRKVMGAEKGQLVKQFMAESFLINLLAMIIALIGIVVCWPSFAALTGRDIPLEYIIDAQFWQLIIGLFLLGTLLSGIYPAVVLSSFKPISVLKGKMMANAGGNLMRKGLVVFQFVSSIVLIIGTIIVYDQLSFMQNQKLGIDINQTLVLEGPGITDSLYDDNLAAFKQEALNIAGVKQMTAASNVPGNEIFWTRGIKRMQGGPESSITVYNVGIDHDYVPAFDLKVVAGRNFDLQFPTDHEDRVLINRELSESLEFESPEKAIGEKVTLGGDTLEIAGVLENYHQMSLKSKVTPLVFRLTTSSSFYSFKIEASNYKDVLAAIEGPWNRFFPGNPIDYFFLDSYFNKQYEGDRQFGQVFGLFSVLAIFVASLGLFGLASFLTIQRTKEIGIRKVLGSTVPNIVLLLSRGFIQLVLIANLIAWPLAWWVMDGWLASFPYRIDINLFLFPIAGFGVILIAFLSVGFQTLKAALLNPAKTLKYE